MRLPCSYHQLFGNKNWYVEHHSEYVAVTRADIYVEQAVMLPDSQFRVVPIVRAVELLYYNVLQSATECSNRFSPPNMRHGPWRASVPKLCHHRRPCPPVNLRATVPQSAHFT